MATILTANANSVEGSLESASNWRQSLKHAVRSGRELCSLLDISPAAANQEAEQDFPVFAPREYVSRMQRGNVSDPLLRQVLATGAESIESGLKDPVGDLESERIPGLLQKYDGRVLLIVSGACAVHCRYCFRRHFPYGVDQPSRQKWQAWLEVIRGDISIDEIILSGGDPLSEADHTLAWFVRQVNEIDHVKRLRIHTRLPVVIPQRVNAELLDWVGQCRPAVFFVLHINHAQEIDRAVAQSVTRLRKAGATLMNQAVLLAGINDDVVHQAELSRALVNMQVIPYYLHQLDPVQGALHFGVTDDLAVQIVQQLRAQLPGYAVPTLVREIAGQPSKTSLRA